MPSDQPAKTHTVTLTVEALNYIKEALLDDFRITRRKNSLRLAKGMEEILKSEPDRFPTLSEPPTEG